MRLIATKRIVPTGVRPKFSTADEWRAWLEAEGRKRIEELDRMNQKSRPRRFSGDLAFRISIVAVRC